MSGKKAGGDGPLFDGLDAQAATQVTASRHGGEVREPRRSGMWLPATVVGGMVAVGLWGAWVTKNVLDGAELPPMARVQMSQIVGEYVQAQARSSSTPETVTSETKAFMGEIERNLKARGARGQVVLVGEAVLTDNVPDITNELRAEIYKKVKRPQVAAVQNDVMGSMRDAMADPSAMAMAGSSSGGASGAGY